MVAMDPKMDMLPVNMGMISKALSRVVNTTWDGDVEDIAYCLERIIFSIDTCRL